MNGRRLLYLNGALSEGSQIGLTNASISGAGETILVLPEPNGAYVIQASDANAFTYLATELQQTSGLHIDAPCVNANGYIIVNVTLESQDIYWGDGAEIETQEIYGGETADDPITITVGGTVTLNGAVSFGGGYVTIVGEEGKMAVLQHGNSGGFILDNSAANLTIKDIAIDGREIYGTPMYAERGTLLLDNCEIRNCAYNGLNVDSSIKKLTIRNSVITNCQNYGIYCTSYTAVIESTEIRDNNIGLYGGGKLKDVRITDNRIGIHQEGPIYLSGCMEISGNEDKDLDMNGRRLLYLNGALSEGSQIGLTNATISGAGETILVQPEPNGGYVIQASDEGAFTYTPTEAQLNGNEVFKKIRLSDNGNIVMPVVYYEDVRVYGASLTLTGEIGVNFYLDIPTVDVPYAVVHIKFRGNTTDFIVADMVAEEAPQDIAEYTDRYKFTGYAAAKEMRDQFTVSITDDEGNPIKLLNYSRSKDYPEGYSYSVSRYFEIVRNDPQYAYAVPLVDAMDNYGKYAQLFFGYNTDELTVDDVSDVTLDVLNEYKNVRGGTLPEGLTYVGSFLTLESTTMYSHVFKLSAGHEISEYRFDIDGIEVIPEKYGDNYKITVDNIAAKRLGEFTTTRVYPVSNEQEFYSIQYCALSYARAVVKTGADGSDVCKALYKYYVAAEEFFRLYGENN